MTSKNILWTGSHGFIAGYAIQKLLDEGHNVIGIDNFWKYGKVTKSYDNHPNFTFYEADAKDTSLLKKIMNNHKINIFVHGAAIIGGISMFHKLAYDLLTENEKLTCAAFDVCVDSFRHQSKPVFEKIVVISSSMVFENCFEYPSKESDVYNCPPPSSTYGFQKLAIEYFAKGAHQQYNLPYTIIRPFNAVGTGESRASFDHDVYSGNIKLAMSHVVPDLIQKILKGQDPLHILGEGNQIRHYTYAGDLANGIYQCIVNPKALNSNFNISTSKGHSVLELAKIVWKKIKGDEPFRYVSDKPFEFDVQKRIPETKKAKDILNIECNTSIEDALDEIIPWIKLQLKNDNI